MRTQASIYLFISVLVVVTVIHRYVEYRVGNNYQILAYGECDPASASCFGFRCMPGSGDECDDSPYKKMLIHATFAPNCILENTCADYKCVEASGCRNIYCRDDLIEEGEFCVSELFAATSGTHLEPDQIQIVAPTYATETTDEVTSSTIPQSPAGDVVVSPTSNEQ